MPGPGRKAEQLNWALRPEALGQVLEADAAEPSRVFVGVFDADSVPDPDTLRWIAGEELRRPAGARLPGRDAVAGELERARHPRPHLRHPAVVDLHAGVAGAPRQRGAAHPPHRPLDRPDPGASRALGPGGARARLPPLADLPRPPSVRPAGRAPGAGRLPDGRRDRGLDARLHAGRARDPDPPDADDRADGSAGDQGEDHPAERALVSGRARRRRLPLEDLAGRPDRVQPRPARPARRSTRSWSGRWPRSSTRPWDTSAGTSPTPTATSSRCSSSSRWRSPPSRSGSRSGSEAS